VDADEQAPEPEAEPPSDFSLRLKPAIVEKIQALVQKPFTLAVGSNMMIANGFSSCPLRFFGSTAALGFTDD
jgi:hypothetical protein